jgi:hypothetical protein
MSRDYTKYNLPGVGENLNKRSLVFNVVKDWIAKNNPSFEELKTVFPDELQGSRGVVKLEKEVTDARRFNMREPISIKNGAHVVICNQWGENINDFINHIEQMGYNVESVLNNSDEIMKSTSGGNSVNSDAKSYILIKASEELNDTGDYPLISSIVAQTNGKYTLEYRLDNDGDGVIDSWHFYDIGQNIYALASSAWGFGDGNGFTDVNEEWTEHDSLEDLGYDSNEIGEEFDKMKLDFVQKYLNEKSQEDLYYNAAVQSNFSSSLIVEENFGTDLLKLEDGDSSILPPER